MSKKLVALVLALLMCLVCLAACAQDPSTPPASSTAPATSTPDDSTADSTPADGIKTGGVMTFPMGAEPISLNPDGNYDDANGYIMANCFNKLLTMDSRSQVIKDLCTDYAVSDDGLTYTFTLRDEVYFHNGEKMTSDDVKFTFEEIQAQNGVASYVMEKVESIECPDELTVEFHLSSVDATLLHNLAYRGTYILPRSEYEGKDWVGADAMQTPVGTGPFLFDSWDRGQRITLVRNPNYFDAPAPYLDKVVFAMVADATTAQTQFLAGEFDCLSNYSDYITLSAASDVVLEKNIYASRFLVQFNTLVAPFDNVEVRKAICYGFDKQEMLDLGLRESGLLAEYWLSPHFDWAVDKDVKIIGYDPDAAAAAFEAAGLTKDASGNYLSVEVVLPNYNPFPDVAEVFKSMMARIGVDVTINMLEYAAYDEQVTVNHDFVLAIDGFNQGPEVGALSRTAQTGGYSNIYGFSNAEVDALFEEALTYATFEDRAPCYARIQEILSEELPFMPFSEWIGYYPHKDYVMNHPASESMMGKCSYGSFGYIWLDQ